MWDGVVVIGVAVRVRSFDSRSERKSVDGCGSCEGCSGCWGLLARVRVLSRVVARRVRRGSAGARDRTGLLKSIRSLSGATDAGFVHTRRW